MRSAASVSFRTVSSRSKFFGATGGIVGASLGLLVVITVAIVQEWTPIIATWTVAVAPVLGMLVGLAAGFYPATRAARIEPIDALRR